MGRIVKFAWVGALVVGVASSTTGVGVAATSVAAKVISPAPDAIVGRVAEVVFETTQPGFPLVLVAAEEKTVEWWVQPAPQVSKPGRYAVAAHFGNSQTPQGKPFHAMVVLVPDEDLAKAMAKQQVLERLPKGMMTSQPVRLLRRFETDATVVKQVSTSPTVVATSAQESAVVSTAPRILRLENRARVANRQEVSGISTGPIDPVILVRAKADGNHWWVQDHVKRSESGEFTALVRFGNEKTPAGSEFLMVVLTPRSTSEAARFKVGESTNELPEDAWVSSEMMLVLAPAAASAE